MTTPTFTLRVIAICLGMLVGSACLAQDAKFDEPPVPSKMVPPTYPAALRKEGVSGMVTMSITVDEAGNVQNPVVKKSTRPEFEQPAVDAVSKWKFDPAKKDGKPVAVTVVVPVKFSAN